MIDYDILEKKLISFIQNELKKTSLQSIIIGLSGGLDSSVVAVLAKKALMQKGLGNNLYAIMLPSHSSNQNHLKDAKALCEKFHINYSMISIGDLVENYFQDKKVSSLRIGNFSARIRMSILYDISAEKNGVVIGTSNKSELALGYGTLYGDLACAFNPIGEIYKSDLFGFAKYLGVNEEIINKPPSADLWEGQTDEEELGFSYAQIDKILKDFLDNNLKENELLNKGHEKVLVEMIIKRYQSNQFKRRLPIVAKLYNTKSKFWTK